MRKHVRIIAVLLSVIFVFCVAAVVATANTDTANDSTSSGRTFSSSDQLSMTNPLETQPMTYKALISVPADASTRGVIFGNYREAGISALNFEITAEGKPSIYFVNSGTDTVTRIEFDYDVRGLGPIDLAVTHTVTDSGAEFVCYANGEAVATATSELALTFSLVGAQRQYRFALGHDWYSSSFHSNYYFKGSIQNVGLYDRALTADEISSLYSDGVSLTETSLMAYYDLTTPENISGTRVTDSTGNGHDFEPLFQETRRDFEYDYSMAVVGDTQHLIYRDAHHNEDWTSPIYDWLVENKYSKNIKFVMGVGDITNRDGKDDVDDGVDNTDVEWDIAVDQLNKLYTAGIPYSLIVGNHDSVSQLDKYFADNPNFTDADIGYYDGNSLGNYYIKFSVDSEKYMVFGLDYGPNDSKLAWAGDVIASNPDHKVIITTHAYMCADGTTLEATDSTSVPRPAEDASAAEKTKKQRR